MAGLITCRNLGARGVRPLSTDEGAQPSHLAVRKQLPFQYWSDRNTNINYMLIDYVRRAKSLIFQQRPLYTEQRQRWKQRQRQRQGSGWKTTDTQQESTSGLFACFRRPWWWQVHRARSLICPRRGKGWPHETTCRLPCVKTTVNDLSSLHHIPVPSKTQDLPEAQRAASEQQFTRN